MSLKNKHRSKLNKIIKNGSIELLERLVRLTKDMTVIEQGNYINAIKVSKDLSGKKRKLKGHSNLPGEIELAYTFESIDNLTLQV
jgi:hypothetical protein